MEFPYNGTVLTMLGSAIDPAELIGKDVVPKKIRNLCFAHSESTQGSLDFTGGARTVPAIF